MINFKKFEKGDEHDLQEIKREACQRALREMKGGVAKMEDFKDVRGLEEISADSAYVERIKSRFQHSPEKANSRELALIFEAILTDNIESSDWMGPDAVTVKTLEFDDIKHGIDMVVEIEKEDEEGALHLGVDVTLGRQVPTKLRSIKDEIESGKLGTVKYFESGVSEEKKKLEKIPKVLVAADPYTVDDLMKLWMSNDKKALAEHPFQDQILLMVHMQLVAFRDYAEKIGKKEVIKKYEEWIALMEEIIGEKRGLSSEQDSAFRAIEKYLEEFGKD